MKNWLIVYSACLCAFLTPLVLYGAWLGILELLEKVRQFHAWSIGADIKR